MEKVPAGQFWQKLAPASLYVPAEHAEQAAGVVEPEVVEYLPASQEVQSATAS